MMDHEHSSYLLRSRCVAGMEAEAFERNVRAALRQLGAVLVVDPAEVQSHCEQCSQLARPRRRFMNFVRCWIRSAGVWMGAVKNQ